MTFPNEVQFDQANLIREAQSSVFEEFDTKLTEAGYPEQYYDFDFTVVHPQDHVIARPKPGFNQKVWGYDQLVNEWFEDITVDAQGVMLDSSGQNVQGPAQTPATGTCPSCGAQTALPNGSTAVFCPSCGTRQAAFAVPLVNPHAVVPAVPVPQAAPSYRMTGGNKKPVIIPEGLGKTDGKGIFADFLDKAIESGKEDEVPDLPSDLASQHEHYRLGTPKR